MMRMDEELVETTDLDWFGVLSNGVVAHFATAGKAYLPAVIRESVENYELAFEYFSSLEYSSEWSIVEDNLPNFANDRSRVRYISPFVEMARRGLYSYDASEDGDYKLIAVPAVEFKFVSEDLMGVLPCFKLDPVDIIFPDNLV